VHLYTHHSSVTACNCKVSSTIYVFVHVYCALLFYFVLQSFLCMRSSQHLASWMTNTLTVVHSTANKD
jgi:hypothetical protein